MIHWIIVLLTEDDWQNWKQRGLPSFLASVRNPPGGASDKFFDAAARLVGQMHICYAVPGAIDEVSAKLKSAGFTIEVYPLDEALPPYPLTPVERNQLTLISQMRILAKLQNKLLREKYEGKIPSPTTQQRSDNDKSLSAGAIEKATSFIKLKRGYVNLIAPDQVFTRGFWPLLAKTGENYDVDVQFVASLALSREHARFNAPIDALGPHDLVEAALKYPHPSLQSSIVSSGVCSHSPSTCVWKIAEPEARGYLVHSVELVPLMMSLDACRSYQIALGQDLPTLLMQKPFHIEKDNNRLGLATLSSDRFPGGVAAPLNSWTAWRIHAYFKRRYSNRQSTLFFTPIILTDRPLRTAGAYYDVAAKAITEAEKLVDSIKQIRSRWVANWFYTQWNDRDQWWVIREFRHTVAQVISVVKAAWRAMTGRG